MAGSRRPTRMRAPAPTPSQADPHVQRWIARELAAAPPRAPSLTITVWGDAIAPHGGAVMLPGLIRLLEPFGINVRMRFAEIGSVAMMQLATGTRRRRSQGLAASV